MIDHILPATCEYQNTRLYTEDYSDKECQRFEDKQFPNLCFKLSRCMAGSPDKFSCRKQSCEQKENSIKDTLATDQSCYHDQISDAQCDDLCWQFHEKGFCLKGNKCEKIHKVMKSDKEMVKKQHKIMNWITAEIPQFLFDQKVRIISFLS